MSGDDEVIREGDSTTEEEEKSAGYFSQCRI